MTWRQARHMLACMAIACACPGVSAQGGQLVTWYSSSLYPVHIPSGPDAHQGFADRVLYEQIMPVLNHYRHVEESVPLARRDILLARTPNACSTALFKTPERERGIVFSEPIMAVLAPGVYVRRAALPLVAPWINAQGRLDLEQVLRQSKLRLGVLLSRSYGVRADALVAEFMAVGRAETVGVEGGTTNLMAMLLADRHQLVLANPYERVDTRGQLRPPSEELQFLPLAGMDPYILAYIGCSKSPLGQRVIAEVNQLLARKAVRLTMQGYFYDWLPSDMRKLAEKAYAQSPLAR